ncbi:hypothetical protein GCM10011581_45340 [Saccharopolyspora subtropica]|uniref:Uncharacterized protein n=1 Tax=Saccharopolyspora thermophila TaxID=89367 RepID=A0A917NJT7_9PSEU|nr:hypothetical protein [Saccharopolyspora subtropica]GGJ03134.1 hypothetical protein GCM10011581_45340 [Saccharopolyspora subtropica]
MGEQLQGLDYWLSLDYWKDTEAYDWEKIDYLVEEGLLSERDRDLIHAEGNIIAAGLSGSGFPEIDAALERYHEASDKIEESVPEPEHDEFDENKDYYSHLPKSEHSDVKAPAVDDKPPAPDYGGEGSEKNVVVNREAMERFVKVVDSLRETINESQNYIRKIEILPGCFPEAYQLRDVINPQEGVGLRKSVLDFLENSSNAFYDITVGMREVINEYTGTEDDNKVTAEKVAEIMNAPYSEIDSLSPKGTA